MCISHLAGLEAPGVCPFRGLPFACLSKGSLHVSETGRMGLTLEVDTGSCAFRGLPISRWLQVGTVRNWRPPPSCVRALLCYEEDSCVFWPLPVGVSVYLGE